jgi:hypothetical protein
MIAVAANGVGSDAGSVREGRYLEAIHYVGQASRRYRS